MLTLIVEQSKDQLLFTNFPIIISRLHVSIYCIIQRNIYSRRIINRQQAHYYQYNKILSLKREVRADTMIPDLSLSTTTAVQSQLLLWKRNHTIRLNLIKELYTTQIQYVTFLSFVHVEIRELFDLVGFPPTLYTEIFQAIPEFYQLHKQILKSFEIVEAQKHLPAFILSPYLDKYIPYFRVYHKYFGTLDKRKSIVNKLKNQNKLNNYQKELNKMALRKEVQDKYPKKFLEYITKIEFVDYLNKPFQRYHQYGLLLSTYSKLLPECNIEKDIIPIIIETLKLGIQELNQTFTKTVQGILTDLDKKYGNILRSSHTFYEDTIVGYYSEGKILEGKLFLFNGMILLTESKGSEKEVKRILLDEDSWFHNLKAGNNNTNTIFIKGVDTHQILILMDSNKTSFLSLMQTIFDQIYFRSSWTKEILGEETKENSFVFKPLSIYLRKNRYVFVVFIKVASVSKGVRTFYSLNELRNIVQYLNETKIGAQSKSQRLHETDEDLGDEEAEHIALGLFEYIIPMLRDIRVCQGYLQLQSLLKIVEYMNWIGYNTNMVVDDYMADWLLASEERLRLKPIPVPKNYVSVNIWLDSSHKKPVRIDKSERVSQVVQKVVGVGHSLEFTLGIGENLLGSRIMDDDEILYDSLKEEGVKFEEEANIFEKGFNVIFGRQEEVNVYLRKYLYLEYHNPAMYIESSEYKLSLLARDYLDRAIPFLPSMEKPKQVELVSLLFRPIRYRDIINDFLIRIFKPPHLQPFKKLIIQQLQQINDIPEIQCFKAALRKTQALGINKLPISCKYNFRDCYFLISYTSIELKEKLTSSESIFKIQFQELIYSVTPTLIQISTPTEEYSLEVNGTYGVQLVLERYMHINSLWSKK